MNRTNLSVVFLLIFTNPGLADHPLPQLEKAWEIEGFDAPESAVYDAERKNVYLSNVNGGGTESNGKGYVSLLTTDGKVKKKDWVTGLHAPKGMALVKNRLFVADIDTLVEIDVEAGKVAKRYAQAEAEFLNDVTADESGTVYVSDMLDTKIYHLPKNHDRLEVWIASDDLEYPNGLLAEGNKLLVGSWGKPKADFTTDVPGHMKVVDLKTKTIKPLGGKTTPLGNLDGVEPAGNGAYFVTDWIAGKLFLISKEGEAAKLLDLPSGAADLEHVASLGLLIIPQMKSDKVMAYRVTKAAAK